MSAIKKIFVSSSFHESFEFGFNDERKLLKDKINGEDDLTDNSLDHGHPEASQGTEEASLQRVGESQLVVFLLGRRYGTIRENGLSLTHEEYNEAVRLNKPKLCYEFPIHPSDEDHNACLEFREQIKKKDDCIVLNIEDEIKKGNFSSVFSEVVKKKSAGEKQEPNEVEKKDYALDLANKILHDIIRQFKNTRYRSFQYVPPIPEDYFPRDTHIEAIKEKLEKNKGVVVSGMSGIGKTTLSIILGNDNNLKNDFKDGIYYLKMGQDPDLEDKQNDLLLHLENSNSKGTLKEIIKQDFADRKALLILDDVWVFEHFLPFDITKQETRSKIIITTRYGIQSFGVLDGFSEYLIEQLNEDESLAMLKQKIGWSTTDSELETICKRMSKKCGGLPLAISAVARVLATDENLKRWQDVENDFETILEKIPADEENRTVYASFQLSINYLEEELRDIYFSLSILFNKHSSFFESETLRVYWGSKSWFILKSLKEASLLTEQISQREQKGYTLHDLQKTFIKEKTKEQDLTNYKKQFIQNYQKKYAPDWHKIPFYEQNNFYHNYLKICQDLNKQNLAKEISKDILYNNPDISLHFVKKTADFLELDLIKEAPKILNTNQNSRVVVLLLNDLEPPKQKTYAQNYLKEPALKAESSFITEKCIEILGTDNEQVRTFAQNYLKEAALKAESDHIIKKCVKILGTDNEQVRTFALNYLKEPALKAESDHIIKKCVEILGTEDEQVRTFALNYLKEPALKDGSSHITIECVNILGTEDEQVRTFALNYLKEAALKAESSHIIIECVKILGTEDEQVRTFAQNYLKEPALKDGSSHITIECVEILGTDDEQVQTFAQNYLKEPALKAESSHVIIECVKILGTEDKQVQTFAQNYLKEPALKDGSSHIIIECVEILGTDDEQVRTFAQNYLKEPALKDGNSHIIKKCVEILGTDNEQVQTFALNYLKEAALKDKNGFVTEKCIEILGTDDEQVRTFAQNYLKEPALKAESDHIIKKCVKILGTDDEQVRTFAQNYLKEPALKDGSSHITIECIKILGTEDEQVRTFAQNYLKEPALKAESSFVIEKCIKILGTDDEQVRTFALNYLKEPALKAESSFVTEKCIEILGTDDEQVRTFAQNYLKEPALKDGNSHITIECIKILGTDDEQVRTFAQNYLKEPALKAESSFITEKCVEILGTDNEQVRTFALNYLKEAALKDKNGFVTEKCIEILGTDDEQVRTFALNYLKEPALKDGNSHITIECVEILGTDNEQVRAFAQNYLKEPALKAESDHIIKKCVEILGTDDEQVRTFALNYLKEAALKDGSSHITIECVKILGTEDEQVRTFAQNYLKEPALKAESSHIIIECVKILGTDNEQVQTFAQNYLKEPALKDGNSHITIECVEILGTEDEQVRTFALNYLKEAALKDGNSHITIECVKILGTDNEQVQTFAQNYLKEPALKDGNSHITIECVEILGTEDEQVRTFALNYLKEAALKAESSHITIECIKILGTDDEQVRAFAQNYLKEAALKAESSHITIECVKILGTDNEQVRAFAQNYLKEPALKAESSHITIECVKILGTDNEQVRTFAQNFKIKKGNIVKGIVKNITDYGVFVDIGGIVGLLHITDMTWNRISHPSEACAIGDTIEVVIMDFDLEQCKVSLGLKQKTADPWENIEKYKLGSIVTGKITNIKAYGLFVELKKDVEGLVHNTELSWSKKITGIEDITQKVGDDIKVVVKEIDKDKRRISLSVKELTPNPWEVIAKTIKKDSIIEGVIQNVTDFGIFISLVQGVDGLVHISDIDWNNRQQALMDVYQKGQKIQVKVISIDSKTERLALGIKQLRDNPWIGIEKKLAAGDLVKGTVRYISEFGLFVETAERIEGLLHINKMDSSLNSKEQLEKKYAVGDTIGVKILKIEASTQKLAFILPKSSKASVETEEKFVMSIADAENIINQRSYTNSLHLNKCLDVLAIDNQTRKNFAEKELKKINTRWYAIRSFFKSATTKILIIQTKVDNTQLREATIQRALELEFNKFPRYYRIRKFFYPETQFFVANRLFINTCLQKNITSYVKKILQCWEKEVGFRDSGRYFHAHIITALKHLASEKHTIKITKKILKKDNKLIRTTKDKDFYFISPILDDAIQELLQKQINAYKNYKHKTTIIKRIFSKSDKKKNKEILELLQKTTDVRKKNFERNPKDKATSAYVRSLNTLSYFHQIHNQQKEAISYKQKATNLAEKICEENPNEILIERQAQYKTELQELTNENTEKNATD